MMTHIIEPHHKLVLANRGAHIPHDRLDLRPRVHAVAIVIPLMTMERERALAVAPGLDAQFLLLVAVVAAFDFRELDVVARVLAPGHLPAMFGLALCARDAFADGHGGLGGPADPVEGVDGAGIVGVEFKVHVGG